MKKNISNIKDKLYEIERCREDLNILVEALYAMKKDGVSAVLNICTKLGIKDCSVKMSKKMTEEFLKVFVIEYNEEISKLKKEIDKMLDDMIFDVYNV